MDQKGQRILPKKKIAMLNTIRKYFNRMPLGGAFSCGCSGMVGLISFAYEVWKILLVTILRAESSGNLA